MKYLLFMVAMLVPTCSFADSFDKVYRAAMETPEQIKNAGGFFPRGMDGSRPNQPPPDINLFNHANGAETGMARYNSGYVSTTTSRGFAINWVNDHLNHNGFVYHIRATPNFIDVNETLRNYSPHSEELEQAALGVIHWSQVIGWERVRGGQIGEFIANPDYRRRLYQNLHSSGAQPQLAGFPDGHPAWSQNPWLPFAFCELRSSCSPKETSQQVGKEWFQNSLNNIYARLMIIF